MWWFKLYPFLVMPCAAAAGLFTWSFTRGRQPGDRKLLQNFLVALVMLLMISAGLSRTEFVRSRWDEGYQAQQAYLVMPVHVAMREHRPDDWTKLEQVALKAFDSQVPPDTVLTQTRMHYLGLARRMMDGATGTALLAYAEGLVPVLEQLHKTEPRLCVRMAWYHVPAEPFDVGAKLPQPVNDGWERGVAQLIAHNSTSAKNSTNWKPEASAALEEVRAALAEMGEPIRTRHGLAPEELFTPAVAQFEPAAACGASTELIKRSLALEPALARTLLGHILKPA
jgi:hypothetical protein